MLPELLKQLNFDSRLTYRIQGKTVRLAKKATETTTDEFRGLLKRILIEQPDAEEFVIADHRYSRRAIEQWFDIMVPNEFVQEASFKFIGDSVSCPKFMVRALLSIDQNTGVDDGYKIDNMSAKQFCTIINTLFIYSPPCAGGLYLVYEFNRSSLPMLKGVEEYFQNLEYGKVITINKKHLRDDDNLVFRKGLLEACPDATHVALELKNGTLSYTKEAFALLIEEYEKEPGKQRDFHLRLTGGKVFPVSFEFYQEVLTVLSQRILEGVHNGSRSNPLDLVVDGIGADKLTGILNDLVQWHKTGIFPRYADSGTYEDLAFFLQMYSTDSRWDEQATAHLRCLPSVDLPNLKGFTWKSLLEYLEPYETAEEICIRGSLRYSRKLIETSSCASGISSRPT